MGLRGRKGGKAFLFEFISLCMTSDASFNINSGGSDLNVEKSSRACWDTDIFGGSHVSECLEMFRCRMFGIHFRNHRILHNFFTFRNTVNTNAPH